jgi:hypothetical protein
MAYQIDFTASNYAVRAHRKAFLRLLLLASVAGAAYGIYDVYTTYNMPTLNMRLAEYESVARPIEEMDAAWGLAAKEYATMARYYRLLWAESPTNFLSASVSGETLRPGKGFVPQRWELKTGGECKLDYLFEFSPGDKAEQAKGVESAVVNAVTSVVSVVSNKVAVQGVQVENLLRVDDLDISVRFSLPDVKSFPEKERTLAECVKQIAEMRKKVKETKLSGGKDAKAASTVDAVMMAYLPKVEKPDIPDMKPAIDISGWFSRADQFIAKHRIPGDDAERRKLKESWNRVGDARFPWDRLRTLDNGDLVARTKDLGAVSDGVKRFKGFLEKRHADCLKKLEPFVEAYVRNDVFNKPLIESDLKDRVAKHVGISDARVLFKDEEGADPAMLEKEDEKFTFTWVRWTLSLDGERGTGNGETVSGERGTGNGDPLTLAKVADCARKTMELGPGYAIDTVKIDFNPQGDVVGAVLEGLLPVKSVTAKKKETTANVD